MSDRRADETSIAPRRSLAGASDDSGSSDSDGPVLPPMPKPSGRSRKSRPAKERKSRGSRQDRVREVSSSRSSSARSSAAASGSGPAATTGYGSSASTSLPHTTTLPRTDPAPSRGGGRNPRQARLRITQVDPWSVTKTAFLLSIALGVVTVVAVAVVWSVLGAAGLWDSIDSAVQETVGGSSGTPFQIEQYVGTSRVLGFTMIVAVVDVVLITMIATLGAFLYNLAATLLGGIEVTLAEDD
jgi:hypothetical protein